MNSQTGSTAGTCRDSHSTKLTKEEHKAGEEHVWPILALLHKKLDNL